MKVINVLMMLLLSFYVYGSNDLSELGKCGIKLDGYISGRNNNFYELDISIDQSIIVDKLCTKISTFSVSNYSENEFMIVDVLNNKLGMTLQFKVKNATNSILTFAGVPSEEFTLMEDSDNGYLIRVSELMELERQ